MSNLPPKSPKWGTLKNRNEGPKSPASGVWGVKTRDLKKCTGYQKPFILRGKRLK